MNTSAHTFKSASGPALTHLAAYAFLPLSDLESLQERVLTLAQGMGIKGTVLLATEGINLFICASHPVAHEFIRQLGELDPQLATLKARETKTDQPAFQRLKVKIKPEIIRYGVPQATPLSERADPVSPESFARWIEQGHDDNGRPLAIIDTRNGFEVDVGTFRGAIDWRIDRFTQFGPQAERHKAEFQDKTVVAFCTGGIRCEKAVLHMKQMGYPSVYQLDGGVLGYFEQLGKVHWDGELFVFDARRGVTDEHSVHNTDTSAS
jgi:UPF0176 protein